MATGFLIKASEVTMHDPLYILTPQAEKVELLVSLVLPQVKLPVMLEAVVGVLPISSSHILEVERAHAVNFNYIINQKRSDQKIWSFFIV